jgi:Flp pilus assembly protein TadD
MPGKWDLKCVEACKADSFDLAEAYFKKAIEYEPTCESVYASFIELALKKEQAARVLPYVNQWMQIQPDNPNSLNLAGWVYLSVGNFEVALNTYAYLNSIMPDMPAGYTGLARAYVLKGDASSAIATLERQFSTVGIDPSSAQLACQLYIKNGDTQKAQQMQQYFR